VLGDPVRLEEVLSNLLNNAAKYTETSGKIAVVVERRGEDAVITVRDTGIGIAPELLPQLFEMFFQADASLDRTGGGLGIGLSIAKRLVELHDGSIDGRSEGLGKGSEFTVRLPILREAEIHNHSLQEEARESSAEISATPHRVMIVDDNSDTVESVAEIVRSWGHEVAVAQDGPSALELASTFRPDIALLDIGLPQMNGYELARRLREMRSMNRMLLVAISGYAGVEDRRRSHEAGFNLHLVKPINPRRLQNLLAHLN
jgi:two-component system, chemotaxis family, CheB/CheR fusion protein